MRRKRKRPIQAQRSALAEQAQIVVEIGAFAQLVEHPYRVSCGMRAAALLMHEQLAEHPGPEIRRWHGAS